MSRRCTSSRTSGGVSARELHRDEVVERISNVAAESAGPVIVILDSVAAELEAYASMVTPGSYVLVQDGVIDILPHFRVGRPGPLPAIADFLRHHPEFEPGEVRNAQFLITHHPKGWLRRRTT